MGNSGTSGFSRWINATRYSAQGLRQAWKHEAAFRQEVLLNLVLVPAALWLGRNPVEKALLIACCVLVLIVELINSAIEAAIDRHGSERHELSGRAKDQGSAAVLLSLLLLAIVWGAVVYDRFRA